MNRSSSKSLKNAGIAVMGLGAIIYIFSFYEDNNLEKLIANNNEKLDGIYSTLHELSTKINKPSDNNKSLLNIVTH